MIFLSSEPQLRPSASAQILNHSSMFFSAWVCISQQFGLLSMTPPLLFYLFTCVLEGLFLIHAKYQSSYRCVGQKEKTIKALVHGSQLSSLQSPIAREGVPFAFSGSWAGLVLWCLSVSVGPKAGQGNFSLSPSEQSFLPRENCRWANLGMHCSCEYIAPLNKGLNYWF